MPTRRWCLTLLAFGLALAAATPAAAQSDYPNRPITLMVPYAAGVAAARASPKASRVRHHRRVGMRLLSSIRPGYWFPAAGSGALSRIPRDR